MTGSHLAGTTVHGLNFEAISVIDQGNRTVQIELRNRFLRYVSAFVQFSDEAGNLVDLGRDATQFDTTRAGFLTWLTSNYTILGIPFLGDDVLLGKFQFDVPPDASIAQVYLGSLGVGGEAFSPEAITGSILTLTFNLGLPTMLLILGAIPNKSLQDKIIIFLSTVAGKKIVVQLLEDVIGGTDPEIVGNGLFGTGNSRNGAVGALANIGNALLKALLSQKAAVAILEALGQNIAEDEALDSAGPLGLVFRLITLAANLSALAQSIGEVLSSPAIFTNTIRLTQTTTVTINHDPNDFRFPATARTWPAVREPGAPASGGGAGTTEVANLDAGTDCVGCDLSGIKWNDCVDRFVSPEIEIDGLDLTGASFKTAALTCVQLINATMELSMFDDASIVDSRFSGGKMTGASFRNALVSATFFVGVKANQVDFSGAKFDFDNDEGPGCLSLPDLRGASFVDAGFFALPLNGSNFAGSDLRGAVFSDTPMQCSCFEDNCEDPDMCFGFRADPTKPCGAVGAGVDFGCSVGQCATFGDSTSGVTFDRVDMSGYNFSGATMTNAVFKGTILSFAKLENADLRSQIHVAGFRSVRGSE